MRLFNDIEDIVFATDYGRSTLGTGAFASVKLVHHRNNKSLLYAMKTVEKRTPKAIDLIKKEIKLHLNLLHPHIIALRDYFDLPNRVYIFLEYAPNGDLFTHMNKRKLSEDECLKFFYQSCEGIRYVHSKNIMHRDLKPENILLDENFNVKIADFGWSAEYFPEENRQTLCGTYEYMAPEVFAKKNQTQKTDVWALGVLFYELCHGHAPFRGTKLEEVASSIAKNVIAFKKSLNPGIKALILSILCFDPVNRPSVQEVLANDVIVEFLKRHPEHDVRDYIANTFTPVISENTSPLKPPSNVVNAQNSGISGENRKLSPLETVTRSASKINTFAKDVKCEADIKTKKHMSNYIDKTKRDDDLTTQLHKKSTDISPFTDKNEAPQTFSSYLKEYL